MGYLFLPTLIFVIAFPGYTPADKLADFRRFAAAQDEEVAVVDIFGAERIGRVVAASETSITLGLVSGTRTFDRGDVVKADRLRDGNGDGLMKGMLIGGMIGLFAGPQSQSAGAFVGGVSVYAGIGYLLDRMSTNRAPLYRSR